MKFWTCGTCWHPAFFNRCLGQLKRPMHLVHWLEWPKCSENQPYIICSSSLNHAQQTNNTSSIQRSRLSKNRKRLWTRAMRLWTRAMPVGFQPIREFPGISRCWDVEDQRSLVLCCGGSIWHFWRRQMPLRQQNIVEISDFEIPQFGSLFWFLGQSFTPNLTHTFSPHPNGTLGTPKMTSKEFECFFHKLPKKIQKLRFALTIIKTIIWSIYIYNILYHVWRIFFTDFSLSFRSPVEATRVASTAGRRGDDITGLGDIHLAVRDGDVPALRHFLRAAPERVHEEDHFNRRLASKNRWLFASGVGGFGWVRCQKKSKILNVWCWKKWIVGFLLYLLLIANYYY